AARGQMTSKFRAERLGKRSRVATAFHFLAKFASQLSAIVSRTRCRYVNTPIHVFTIADVGLFSPKLSTKHMAYLCRKLAELCRGAIPVDRALALIASEHSPYPIRRIIPPIVDHIRNGGTLTGGFRAQRRVLPDEFIELIAAAEHGGKTQVAFEQLAFMYTQRLAYLQQLIRDMAYPLCVWLSAAYVIPFFRGLAVTAEIAGTYTTNFFLAVIASWAPILIVLIALGQLGLLEKIGREVTSRVWPLSVISRRLALIRFLRSLAMLLEAGLTMTKSIERAAATTVNPHVRKKLVTAVPLVQRGETLTEALAATNLLPDMAMDMVRTGEYSGRLDELLHKCAQYFEDELHHSRNTLRIFMLVVAIPAAIVAYGFLRLFPAGTSVFDAIASIYRNAG
ncbi:MAG: type II secretion system F family protein, partial [Candidatus Hydrogenedentes bacterium]|nr:type II secretion system F family protein [Candidatus Hydrogenedentota bacterium]